MDPFASSTTEVLNRLPDIHFRHLETLHVLQREESYANAARELHTTRHAVKRICDSLEAECGRPLIVEEGDGKLSLTVFGRSLLAESAPLFRSFIHLGEGIRSLQRKGRILRFAASNNYFHDGALASILDRINVIGSFRPCYLRIEPDRYKAALLNSECDVYFGAALSPSDRLEIIPLDAVPWSIHPGKNYPGGMPASPADMVAGKWLIESMGDDATAKSVLKQLQQAGAEKGRIMQPGASIAADELLLTPEPSWMGLINVHPDWPMFLFSAAIKKQHPYSELLTLLQEASKIR